MKQKLNVHQGRELFQCNFLFTGSIFPPQTHTLHHGFHQTPPLFVVHHVTGSRQWKPLPTSLNGCFHLPLHRFSTSLPMWCQHFLIKLYWSLKCQSQHSCRIPLSPGLTNGALSSPPKTPTQELSRSKLLYYSLTSSFK